MSERGPIRPTAALGNLGLWLPIGVVLGVVIGLAMSRRGGAR
jgi:hypothetical protein